MNVYELPEIAANAVAANAARPATARHGMRAGTERLVLLAVITPRPGAP